MTEQEPSKNIKPDIDEHSLEFRLYNLATGEDDTRLCRDIPEDQCRDQPKSFISQIIALALSKTGDALADSKIVLPWLLGAVGAPTFLVGFLVPIRESFALLPQILVGGFIRKFPVRKGFWAISSLAQGGCVILMGMVALSGFVGATAGWAIVGLLVLFSLARGVASIAAKDTLGKTISKGRRGRVNGYAATVSGVFATLVGIYLALSPENMRPDWLIYAMLISAGACWVMAAVAFNRIDEHPGATEGGRRLGDLIGKQIAVLLKDKELQKFLYARALMISTALAGPVYVSLAQRETGQTLDGLGWLMIASGLAGAVSSAIWGAFSDKSSRMTMVIAATLAGSLGVAVVLLLNVMPQITGSIFFYAAILFVLGIAHAGIRIGRKTHVVDLAGSDKKAEYVALSNTLIGVLLLIMGGVVSILLVIGLEVSLLVLSVASLFGAMIAMLMKNVQA